MKTNKIIAILLMLTFASACIQQPTSPNATDNETQKENALHTNAVVKYLNETKKENVPHTDDEDKKEIKTGGIVENSNETETKSEQQNDNTITLAKGKKFIIEKKSDLGRGVYYGKFNGIDSVLKIMNHTELTELQKHKNIAPKVYAHCKKDDRNFYVVLEKMTAIQPKDIDDKFILDCLKGMQILAGYDYDMSPGNLMKRDNDNKCVFIDFGPGKTRFFVDKNSINSLAKVLLFLKEKEFFKQQLDTLKEHIKQEENYIYNLTFDSDFKNSTLFHNANQRINNEIYYRKEYKIVGFFYFKSLETIINSHKMKLIKNKEKIDEITEKDTWKYTTQNLNDNISKVLVQMASDKKIRFKEAEKLFKHQNSRWGIFSF